ncbi:MAG: DMT family transporter [Rhodocyclaceae bacterium]|nr:DMT family transporter [Rhodocyclaceae bacterium]
MNSGALGSGIALAILAAFGLSFKAIFVKLAYPYGVDAITLLALRMLFAAPVFLWVGFAASRGQAPLGNRERFGVVVMGLAGYYGASIFDFLGLQYVSAGLERLILFTYPTLTLLLNMALARRFATRREMLALILCYAGIAAAFWHDLEFSTDRAAIWLGGGLVFASALCYTVYLTGSAGLIARLGAARFTSLATLVSTVAVSLHFIAVKPLSALIQPLPVYGHALAMGLLCTALPIFAQSAAIHRLGSSRVALVSMIGPLLTIVFAAWLLAEPLSVNQILGAALVVSGVTLIGRRL